MEKKTYNLPTILVIDLYKEDILLDTSGSFGDTNDDGTINYNNPLRPFK